MIGQTIAGYEVLGQLGAGGMGVVYKARHTRLRRFVALKFLPPEQVVDQSRERRFLHEARAASALNHPGIVTIHDVVTHEGSDVIVMELVEGESLDQRIPTGGLPWREAAELAKELSEAMAAAHDAGIVHRDLKPANIMVTAGADHQTSRIKVLDFGIAKLVPQPGGLETTLSQFTEHGARPGTPAYMAPEQLLGELIDKRADIFSFGILFYQMLTGQRPFRSHNSALLVDEILYSDPPGVRELRPDVPAVLAALIDKALAKQPGKRFQNMGEIGVELRSLLRSDRTAEPGEITEGVSLKALVACDLVESTVLTEPVLTEEVPEEIAGEDPEHENQVQDLIQRYRGREVPAMGGSLLLFELPWDAVRFALALHRAAKCETRVAIHLGEVTARCGQDGDGEGEWAFDVEAPAQATAVRLLSLAGSRQTLLTHAAFDLARHSAARQDSGIEALAWLAHGDYVFSAGEEIEIFEVGAKGLAPLRPPAVSGEVRRAPAQGKILGWRPAPGLAVPQRPNWVVERKLGEGGFGEVWLAVQHKTHERRVFKFCYEAERLRSLQREITVFRLLKEELGERDDIARLMDWNLDEAPYFIESAYTEGGSLVDWSEAQGGIAGVDLDQRLEFIAQVATALEAAHSVGVLHKDVKPANVLVTPGEDGRRAVLSDFGIGLITDRERLMARGITVVGLTEEGAVNADSPGSGTHLYMAPELLVGGTPTIQSDIYALGVMLYQVAVGDLDRPLAQGWKREIDDELLREDTPIASTASVGKGRAALLRWRRGCARWSHAVPRARRSGERGKRWRGEDVVVVCSPRWPQSRRSFWSSSALWLSRPSRPERTRCAPGSKRCAGERRPSG